MGQTRCAFRIPLTRWIAGRNMCRTALRTTVYRVWHARIRKVTPGRLDKCFLLPG